MTETYPASGLTAKHIRSVTPFDPPRMEDGPECLPKELRDPLLHPIDGLDMPMFALLDAAKIPNLPEMLELWQLPHCCLFQDDALEDAGSVAPWITQLEPETPLLRTLFTHGDGPMNLWGKDAAVFLRSAESLDALARHFRKFTRMQDPRGKWFYVRFYDPPYLLALIRAMSPEKQRRFLGPVARMVIPEKSAAWVLA